MIKMSYEQLSKTNFQQVVAKLANLPMKTPEAFKVKHIVKHLGDHQNKMREAFLKDVAAPYAKGGETPEPPTGEKALALGLPFEPIEGKEDAAKQASEDFGKREFTVPHNKITADYLFSVGEWKPVELLALEPIVAELYLEQ